MATTSAGGGAAIVSPGGAISTLPATVDAVHAAATALIGAIEAEAGAIAYMTGQQPPGVPNSEANPANSGQNNAPSSLPSIRTGIWGKGSFDSASESLTEHFAKHGAEVGAKDIDQYLRKAEAFAQNLRGATKSVIDGATPGVTRYKKLGKYIDLDRDGNIISLGLQ